MEQDSVEYAIAVLKPVVDQVTRAVLRAQPDEVSLLCVTGVVYCLLNRPSVSDTIDLRHNRSGHT